MYDFMEGGIFTQQTVDGFLNYLTDVKHMAKNTVLSYGRDVMNFLHFEQKKEKQNLTEICEDYQSYLEQLRAENRSSSTISRVIASLRCFFRYLVGQHLLTADPSRLQKYEKTVSETKRYEDLLTTDEVDRLISCARSDDIKGYRDCAILETLYATGLKVSDFLNLRLEDLHLKEGYLTVESDGHIRYVPLYKGALRAIRDYLRFSRKHLEGANKTDVVFLNQNGDPLSRQGLWKLLKSYAKKANISKEITPHLFRQSMAMHLVENGADLTIVQELLGHKNITLTKNYVRDFKPKIVSDYKKYHPKSHT